MKESTRLAKEKARYEQLIREELIKEANEHDVPWKCRRSADILRDIDAKKAVR